MNLKHPPRAFWIITVFLLVADRAVKLLQVTYMQPGDTVAVIPGVFHLTYLRNTGAAFSILQGKFWVFSLAMALLVALIIWYWRTERPRHWMAVAGMALVFAGALGNMIDRYSLGYVIDIFDFRLINFAVFNVADTGITVGCVLFALSVLFFNRTDDTAVAAGADGAADGAAGGSDVCTAHASPTDSKPDAS
ncbi:MAG: signal peptidase II [Actinomycetes bacterium]|jgi:signal peptidase II|nr:signal peptidase II [Actinomycetes bacterium]